MKNKKLHIAQLSPLWIPVPPRTYGGIELMLSLLTEEMCILTIPYRLPDDFLFYLASVNFIREY